MDAQKTQRPGGDGAEPFDSGGRREPLTSSNDTKTQDARQPIKARRAQFAAAIAGYVAGERADCVPLTALPPNARAQAQRQALMISAARWARSHPRADCALAVAVFDTLLGDDDRTGGSTLANARLARVLGRTDRAVTRARQNLARAGDVTITVRPGRTSVIAPVVAVCMGRWRDALTWVVDALAHDDPRRHTSPLTSHVTPDVESCEPLTSRVTRHEHRHEQKDARIRARGFRGVDPGSVESRERREAEVWLEERAGGGERGRDLVAALPDRPGWR